MRRLWGALLAAWLVAGCGGQRDRFVERMAAADRAKSSGRYDEAASAYGDAARDAKKPRDRDEALYLQAATYAQAGRAEEAKRALEALATLSPRGERADRALFDRAELEIQTGDEEKGYAMLESAVLSRPTLFARRALRQVVDRAEEKAKGGALAWLRSQGKRLAGTELAEDVDYLTAMRLEESGDLAAARDAFVACAKAHPYPKGSLFDDAWYRAALLDVRLSQPKLAIEHLRAMLASRESSTLGQGSYERPRYAAAQLEIAKIARDQLQDRAMARREFHRLFTDHQTSVLRDDALFEEILLARSDRDERATCELTRTLVEVLPESRYSACSHELCEKIAPPKGAMPCRDYVKARIEGRPVPPDEGAALPDAG